jgi:hypothetical protein
MGERDHIPSRLPGYVLAGVEWTSIELGSGTSMREFAHRRRGTIEDIMVVVLDRARSWVLGHSEAYPLNPDAAREALLSWFLVDRADPARQSEVMGRLGTSRELWQSTNVKLGERKVEGERIEYEGWWLVCVLTPAVIIGVAGPCEENLAHIVLRAV